MSSSVEIANRALSKLGEARITDLTDNNKAARAMSARFEPLRDAELAGSAWRFAVKRVQIAALAGAPAWGYSLRYQLPNDFLRPLMVGDHSVNIETIGVYYETTNSYNPQRAPFEVIGAEIHTDQEAPLKLEYVSQITDSGLFTPLFVEVLACRLAADAAIELTQSPGLKDRMDGEYQFALRSARRQNALWRAPQRRVSSPWMISRF